MAPGGILSKGNIDLGGYWRGGYGPGGDIGGGGAIVQEENVQGEMGGGLLT